ncbi:hypothetical protein [Mycobacteroides abscessus]|uniref:hypothetical protein n=1 Tax=Mycobacteroides abscessus TaxID=36809 RepID=UPI000C265148|nr:hypothetical protein [Mycobacteroides abscessus]
MMSSNSPAGWPDLFYSLPIEDVAYGASTATGQDVISIGRDGDYYLIEVYTSRSDDPRLDESNRDTPESLMVRPGKRIELCVFQDTELDLSGHPNARDLKVQDGGDFRPISREDWLARIADFDRADG